MRRLKGTYEVWTSPKFELGDDVHLRILQEKNGRAEIAIIVNDDTTLDKLRGAWTDLLKQRDRLLNLQGTDFSDEVRRIQLAAASLHEIGASYQFLAMIHNSGLFQELCISVLAEAENLPIVENEALAWARLRLAAVKMKESDIDDYLELAQKEIRDGRAPWSLDQGPISRERMRNAIRQFDREFERGDIVIKDIPSWEPLTSIPSWLARKALKLSTVLLEKRDGRGGLDLLQEAQERMIRSSGTSSPS